MAYSIGYDIIIEDADIVDSRQEQKDRASTFEELLSEYKNILSRVKEECIKSGETNQNLSQFLESAGKLSGEAKEIAKLANQYKDEFLSDMDIADSCIF